jgi:hypothetical protein
MSLMKILFSLTFILQFVFLLLAIVNLFVGHFSTALIFGGLMLVFFVMSFGFFMYFRSLLRRTKN